MDKEKKTTKPTSLMDAASQQDLTGYHNNIPLYNVKWTVTGNFPLCTGEKEAAAQSLQQEIQRNLHQEIQRSLTAAPFEIARPPQPTVAPCLQAQASSHSTPKRPRRFLGLNDVRDMYIAGGDMSPSMLHHFVTVAAEHGHKGHMPNTNTKAKPSPRTNLYNRFKDINSLELSDCKKSLLKEQASRAYIKTARQPPPTVTTTYKANLVRRREEAPTEETPRSEGGTVDTTAAPPPSDSDPPTDPRPNDHPKAVLQHRNQWENVPVAFTCDNELLARDFLERNGIGSSSRSDTKNAPLSLHGTPLRPHEYHNEFKCIVGEKNSKGYYPRGHCFARLIHNKCSENQQFQVKLVRSPTCACRGTEYGPNQVPSIVQYHLQNSDLSREFPGDITKKIIKEMSTNDYWRGKLECPQDREKLIRQITNKVKNERKKMKATCPLNQPVVCNADLTNIKQHYMFKLPPPKFPPLDNNFATEESVRGLGEELYHNDYLNPAVPNDLNGDKRKQAYRLQTILKGQQDEPTENLSAPEIELYRRIEELMTDMKHPNPDAWEKVAVCSSLALLWNMKQVHDLDYDCACSADGTDNMASNNYHLLNWGAFSTTTTGTRSFRPFGVAFVPSESELYFSILLVTLLKYGRRLFGIAEFNFKGLFISDHSPAFVNAFVRAFPQAQASQCYTHIHRKFNNGKGNGQYRTKYGTKFIAHTALNDVHNLHQCLTKEMFETYWGMVSEAWDDLNRKKFRITFEKVYIRNPKYNRWYIGASSGRACMYPDNNPNEKWTGDIKGTKNRGSPARIGKELGIMLQQELPRIIFHASINSVGVAACGYLVDDESKVFTPSNRQKELLKFASENQREIDVFPPPNVDNEDNQFFYVNTLAADERCITEKRVQDYEDALRGICHFEPVNRHLFIKSTTQFCKVKKIVADDGSDRFRGSCLDFLKSGYCVHSAYLSYGDRLKREAPRIETHRKRKHRVPTTHNRRSDNANRQQLTAACHRIAISRTSLLNSALEWNLPPDLIQLLRTLPDPISWLDKTHYVAIHKWRSEEIDRLVLPIETQAKNVISNLQLLTQGGEAASLEQALSSIRTLQQLMTPMDQPKKKCTEPKKKSQGVPNTKHKSMELEATAAKCSRPELLSETPPSPQDLFAHKQLFETCLQISQAIMHVRQSVERARETLDWKDKVKAKLLDDSLSAIVKLPNAYDWYWEAINGKSMNRSVMLQHMEHAELALRPAADLQSSFQAFLLCDSPIWQKSTSISLETDIKSLEFNLAMLTGDRAGEPGNNKSSMKQPPPSAESQTKCSSAASEQLLETSEPPEINEFTPPEPYLRNVDRRQQKKKPTHKEQPLRRSQRKQNNGNNQSRLPERRSGRKKKLTEKMRAHATSR